MKHRATDSKTCWLFFAIETGDLAKDFDAIKALSSLEPLEVQVLG